ncbi:hypothetical protein FN846DRAFT_904642 [Sphaerosporella brunnea]|uniref:Leucine rich repeat protein n=1 Tax=Sphaerosporella brunnea TaxID=1250544 RepID=A0A5J5F4B6_9PEZI|nr:hypothetical protein FN846DRAFT_904642 [Sphaerosporella brunnea]
MAKLNYTNRKISGEKLGAVVKKDVLKHSVAATPPKARAPKDPHLEVNLQGKDLGDDGLEIACEGLVQALASDSVRLDELHLAENNITLNGLKFLGNVIKQASKDLKDLDLRANKLAIVTQADAEHWEQFLRSFKQVCCLRRLDISENPIGDRGFEILLKVYSREPPVYLPKAFRPSKADLSDDDYPTDGLSDDSDGMEELYHQARNMALTSKESPSAARTPPRTDADPGVGKIVSPRPITIDSEVELQGLRSIPYLILSKTGMTDSTALFLSYILPVHYTPERLMPYFPVMKTKAEQEALEAYYTHGCRGIIYKPNNSLSSPLSQRVLECAESMREGRACQVIEQHKNPFYSPKKSKDAPPAGYKMVPSGPPPPIQELERARTKIQGVLLKEKGPHGVALWSSALQVMVVARQILFDPCAGPFEGHTRCFGRSPGGLPLSPLSASIVNSAYGKVPSTPVTPFRKIVSGSPVSAQSSGAASARQEYIRCFPSLNTPPKAADKGANGTDKSLKASDKDDDRKCLGGLPEKIWKRIILLAADPEGLLSEKQLSNMVDWAKTRDTLEKERELAGKLKCQQIWRILEATECLAYEGL